MIVYMHVGLTLSLSPSVCVFVWVCVAPPQEHEILYSTLEFYCSSSDTSACIAQTGGKSNLARCKSGIDSHSPPENLVEGQRHYQYCSRENSIVGSHFRVHRNFLFHYSGSSFLEFVSEIFWKLGHFHNIPVVAR
jgi:hypothetical protein